LVVNLPARVTPLESVGVTLSVRDEWVNTRFGDRVGVGIRVGVNVTPEPLMAFDEGIVHELPQSSWLFRLEKSRVNWFLYAKACPVATITTPTSNTISVGIVISFIMIPACEPTYIKPALNVQLIYYYNKT